MRIERSVTSVSWIPSEAVTGVARGAFAARALQYDDPPPDRLADLEHMRRAGAFRFANELRAWIDVEDGRVTGHGYTGRGYVSDTRVRLGPRGIAFKGVSYPELRASPEVGATSVRFVQTAGGRTGAPLPALPGGGRPAFAVVPPSVWTTLALTIHADGAHTYEVVGASPFPRHWIYDDEGAVSHKVAVADFATWMASVFGNRTPWGGRELAAPTAVAESPLERRLSTDLMRPSRRPLIRPLRPGETLTTQGAAASEIYLVLDGLLDVDVDGEVVGHAGPGMIVGERAYLSGGRRTATVRAVTHAKVAVAAAEGFQLEDLESVAAGHRRELDAPR
jgi:hypothetical protein